MSFPKAMMLLFLLVAIVPQSMGTEDPSDFQVVFGGHSAEGQLMTRQETASAPSIAAPSLSATSSDLYTVLMTDPDAPSPSNPTCKSWIHWIYVDASGSHLTGGTDVVPYAPPTPPAGVHTYHVALYKQSSSLASIKAPPGRCKFDPESFSAAHGLKIVAERTIKVAAPDA